MQTGAVYDNSINVKEHYRSHKRPIALGNFLRE
jgi:hypothetical protein